MLTDQVAMDIEGEEVKVGVGNVGEPMLDVVAGSGYVSNSVQVTTKFDVAQNLVNVFVNKL